MPAWNDDEAPPPLPPRAEPAPRLFAALVDGTALLLLFGLYFTFPLVTGGAALPIWGVFAAVVGYSVVPLALYGATAGMALFGLQLVGIHGRPPQVIDLLFRELIGRGYFPFAYIGSLAVGLVGSFIGAARFTVPAGAGFLLLIVSVSLLSAALAGNLLALLREDGRTLADLMAKTAVTPARAASAPTDAEGRADAQRQEGRKLRILVIAELGAMAVGFGLPWLISLRVGEDTGAYADRLIRERLQHQFAASPADEALALELSTSLRNLGREEEGAAVWAQHLEARIALQQSREKLLRASLREDPRNPGAFEALMNLLEGQERTDDARAAYAAWVAADPQPVAKVAFGIWLQQRGFHEEAITELTAALEAGGQDVDALAHRGLAKKALRRYREAREDLIAALAQDPSRQDVAEALEETHAQ